jgi:DNA polymerase III subunit delta'
MSNKLNDNKIFEMLLNQIKNNKTYHAYLFEIADSKSRMTTAINFAKMLFCKEKNIEKLNCDKCDICNIIDNNNYSELKIIEPEGLIIKKEQIVDLKADFNKLAVNNNKKVYIINNCEKLNNNAANSLLKFLEEPEDGIIAILLTNNIYQVLKTITSRCQIIKMNNIFKEERMLNKISNLLVLDQLNNNDFLSDERLSKTIDMIFKFLNYLEKNQQRTIVEIDNLWNNNILTKEELVACYDIMILIYKDVLNYMINIKINVFDEYKNEIDKLSVFNTKEKVIEKIKILLYLKDKIKYNANNNLLMDKLVIEFSEV